MSLLTLDGRVAHEAIHYTVHEAIDKARVESPFLRLKAKSAVNAIAAALPTRLRAHPDY
jgi:hypothetical protein